MILLFTFLASFLLIGPSWEIMTTREFETFIEPICFRLNEKGVPLVNGQENPLASTLENFISLVEKFEIANPHRGLREELYFFIRNYTYTNIEYNSVGDVGVWTPKDLNNEDISVMWEMDENRRKSFPQVEDPFTDAEKCSLYFMISHSIVRKAREIKEQRAVPVMQNGTRKGKWGSDVTYNDADLYPLEQGVVAIQGTEEAVSLGRVLTGMYVGLTDGPKRKRDIASYERIPKEYIPSQGNVVDPLYTLTIAEVISMAAWRPEAGGREFLAENGYWRSIPVGSDLDTKDACPMIYRLRDGTESAYSYSSMRGAADGLILGKVSGAIEKKKQDVKLSQVLRQYYSRGGFVEAVPDIGDIRASFCNREFLLGNWEAMIKEQVRLFLLLASTSYKNIENNLEFTWNKFLDAKTKGVFQNINNDIKAYCGAQISVEQPSQLPLESPLDVIAVLKTNTNEENFKREQLIIGALARRLHLSHTGSRMTILTDQSSSPPSTDGTIYLKTIVENSYSSACAACSVTQLAIDPSTANTEDKVIIAINQYLTVRRENETRFNGVNGKVVILFNFDEDLPVGRPNPDQVRLEKALRDLYLEHQDVYIFALGKNPEVLKKYSKDDATFAMNAFDATEEEIGNQLYVKVITVPSKLQYPDCVERKSERSAIFEDYVSPNSVQHWIMPAKYFYKSFDLKFTFETFYGEAKICHSRSTRSPELENVSCQEISAAGKPIEFKHSNPCKGFTQYNCAPFFFSILGINKTDGTDKDYCDDKATDNKCKTLDQIKFKVTHEGIRCNGAMGLVTSSASLIFALFVFHLFFKFA